MDNDFFWKAPCELLLIDYFDFYFQKCYGLNPGSHACWEWARPLRPIVLLRTKGKVSGVFGTTKWLIQILLRIGGRG